MSRFLFDLNQPQRDAVRHVEGPCLVIAGAGSGKTRVIARKMAHLVEAGMYEAQHIAALTFTNKAASEMRERVSHLLTDSRQAGRLLVCTFHALGVQMLRQDARLLGLKERFSIMDSDDCLSLIQNMIVTTDKSLARRVQSCISSWKGRLVEPDSALSGAESEDEAQAARIYRDYVATLRAYQSVDFDDLILLPVTLFREYCAVRDKWQRQLRYLLVDEYQDTNICQYMLMKLLVTGPGKKSLFTAVGDDDQSIYAWRGASLENMTLLKEDFPDLKLIRLEQNYRSSTRILQAANAVISHNPKLFDKELWSDLGPGDPVKVTPMENEEQEAEQIAISLSAHRFERKTSFSDYAILYRGNHQSRLLETALRKERIPYSVSGGQSFFSRAEIRDVVSYLRLIANNADDPAFIRALTTPRRGVGQATLSLLGQFAGECQCALFDAVYREEVADRIAPRQLQPLRQFCDFIGQIALRAARPGAGSRGDGAAALLDEMIQETGYEAWLYDCFDEKAARAKWGNVTDFTGWLKERAKGDRAAGVAEKNLLELTQMVSLMTMLENQEGERDAVRLSTLHAAKGLEFSHVYLVGVEEGLLPHHGDADAPISSNGGRIEEERRLMYVGITRAKRSLQISWCKKRKRGSKTRSCERSRFIDEMRLDEQQSPFGRDSELTSQERIANLMALLK
ncbi:MAG: UvrD-helicase domain-containing protein [Burkholderiaceae bacterium]|nr:UvrD-helicase domain-containing protein [Burkholderiaceae bacterium]